MAWMIPAAMLGGSVLSSLLAPEGGGGGGGVSAKTQGGENEVAFNPVGYETSKISPFEYMQQEFDREQAQNMKYGGPLYRGKGGDIATDIFSQGIKDLMPEGIMGILLSSYFLDHENDNEEEESIVPGLNDGGGIGSMFQQTGTPQFPTDLYEPPVYDSNAPGREVVVVGGETNTQASASPTDPISSKEMNNEMLAQLEQIMQTNKRNEAFTSEGTKVLKTYLDRRNKKSSVKGRGNIVPGSGGGRANRQQRQKTASQGITPFQYRAMQGGGALNRQMFAQNYMPNGGDIRGPGGPKDDVIPVMASNGEYMLSKAAVDQAGRGNHARGIANLEQFNNRGNRRYG